MAKNFFSKAEKREIFLALLEKYPSFDKSRRQAREFFKDKELETQLRMITQQEKTYYILMKKIGDEVGWDLPKYTTPANKIRIEKLKMLKNDRKGN